MNLPNSPQTVFNGFASVSRNVYLTSSIGIALFGFSKTFVRTSSEFSIRVLSTCIFIFSILTLLNGNIGFTTYLNNLEKDYDVPNYIDVKSYRRFITINYLYLLFLGIIVLLATKRTIIKTLGL